MSEPTKIFLGSYPGGATAVVIPADVLQYANAALDGERERQRQQADAHAPKHASKLKAAKAAARFRRAMAMMQWRTK